MPATPDDLMPYVLSMHPRDCADVLRLRETIKNAGDTLHRLFGLLAYCTNEERAELSQLVRDCIDSMRNIQ